ncbi:MAG: polymer-forming cytoskeletal protein [Bacteroidetes bacterium]|nr:polymer-forming cytoskeletal protein [Bacteroidota bacterium]
MFNKNSDSRKTDSGTSSINLIGAGTVVEGDIKSNGDIRIDGSVRGNVVSKAKVVVGATGSIDGNVTSQNADVSGSIRGKVTVNELLFLKSSANIQGDIVTGKLVVEVGATFTGTCNMGPMIKDMHNNNEKQNELKEKTGS